MRQTIHVLVGTIVLFACGLAGWSNPTEVWVNTGWTAENCGGHTWQTDAFASIQVAVTAVEPGGTVNVAAGIYADRVVIEKSVTLLGACAGIDPNIITPTTLTARWQESRLIPPSNDVTLPSGALITVKSSNVTIDGFLLDGDNPALSGGENLNGVDANAAAGIVTDGGEYNGVLISHNIIKNLLCDGVLLEDAQFPLQLAGNNAILYNRFENLPKNSWPDHPDDMPPVWGTGVRVVREYCRVAYNTFTNVACGMDLRWISSTEGTGTPLVTGNTIQASNAGIEVLLLNDMLRQAGPETTISGNTIAIATTRQDANAFPTAGITILYIEHQSKVLVSNNTITGGDAGILLWEIPTYNPTNVTIVNTAISNARYGIWFMNYYPNDQFGPGRPSGIYCSGVTISNPQVAGIYLQDDSRGDGPVTLSSTGVSVTGGPVGVLLDGPRALLDGMPTLTGQTVQAVELQNGASLPQ